MLHCLFCILRYFLFVSPTASSIAPASDTWRLDSPVCLSASLLWMVSCFHFFCFKNGFSSLKCFGKLDLSQAACQLISKHLIQALWAFDLLVIVLSTYVLRLTRHDFQTLKTSKQPALYYQYYFFGRNTSYYSKVIFVLACAKRPGCSRPCAKMRGHCSLIWCNLVQYALISG